MTAVALFREHEAGRLDLDAPVHRYLPWPAPGHPGYGGDAYGCAPGLSAGGTAAVGRRPGRS